MEGLINTSLAVIFRCNWARVPVAATRVAVLLVLLLALGGCAWQPEGTYIEIFPDKEDYDEFIEQLKANQLAAGEAGLDTARRAPGVIIVGRVGPYRDFSDERVFEKYYERYTRIMTKTGEAESALSRDELRERAAGWTTITFRGIPQLGFSMARSFVPPDKEDIVDFSSAAGTFFGGAREDLVAAVADVDFTFFVISDLLCEDGPGYSECADSYDWGLYDIYTGRELNTDFEIKEDGVLIDPETKKVVTE